MISKANKLAATFACVFFLAGAAYADEEMDKILETAMPYMHHSCESVIETYGDDEEGIAQIVRLMAMVSLYNREIDVLKAVPDEDNRTLLKDEFVEELEDACDDDPGMLLAGAVDLAVKETMEVFE
jgi:hypothetical protein